ncbi:hypothetical protein [Phaeodactylibacter luteus]|nr:hypothetical protein [Phaeodactylibacter luteus]
MAAKRSLLLPRHAPNNTGYASADSPIQPNDGWAGRLCISQKT